MKRPQPVRLVAVSTVAMPDPRVSHPRRKNGNGHQRAILVSVFIDSKGRAWERYGNEPWARIESPTVPGSTSIGGRRVKS